MAVALLFVLVGIVSTAAPATAAVPDTCGQPGSFPCAEHSYGSPKAKFHLAVLGDSYAAGLGAQSSPNSNSYTSGPPCYQSEQSYAGQIALDSNGTVYSTLAACTGATISNVINTQLHDLNKSFDAVTISAGGNDIGFAKIATDCEELQKSKCDADLISANKTLVSSAFVSKLATLYADILRAAPNAHVYVMGYPYLFPLSASTTCLAEGPAFQFGPKLVKDANILVYNIDSDEYSAAQRAGLRTTFINPTNPAAHLSNSGDKRLAGYFNFDPHNVCGNSQWIHGIILVPSSDTVRSFHPNYRGNSAYAALLALYIKEYQ
ncbi:MAG TPA: SGNH/GDSL hydrolase family protein [Acidimicrobiales bacterium]|nr:SGNH/GDSL hydrolase family protein [Acidimicrobiales bacterium]